MHQQRRPVVLATAAAVVLALAVVAALVTWGYVRDRTPSGSPLAVGVVFAAVLTAGAVGLVILAGRPELDATGRVDRLPAIRGGSGPEPSPTTTPTTDAAGDVTPSSADTDPAPADDPDPPTAEQPRTLAELAPRTAMDPLGRSRGRHARPEVRPEADETPMPSELYHPLPSDLAATLHDQLFTHRSSARD